MAILLNIDFDCRVFSIDSVKKAAYRFIDKFSSDIALAENKIICSLNFSSNISAQAAAHILEDFKKEVLDQDLRATIASETEGVRNLVLAHTFSRTSLING